MSKYLFSVIIPVYNAQKYIEDCLTSILSQSFYDYEIIIVNDGSTDNSENILNDYACKNGHIRVLHKQNQGPLLARVDAINLAESEYCIFVDSDDCLDSDFFNTLKNEIDIQKHDIFIYNYELISSEGVAIRKAESLFVDQSIFSGNGKTILYKTIVEVFSSDIDFFSIFIGTVVALVFLDGFGEKAFWIVLILISLNPKKVPNERTYYAK